MIVTLEIDGITIDKYLQIHRIMCSNKAVKGWVLVELSQLVTNDFMSYKGAIMLDPRKGVCTITVKKVKK